MQFSRHDTASRDVVSHPASATPYDRTQPLDVATAYNLQTNASQWLLLLEGTPAFAGSIIAEPTVCDYRFSRVYRAFYPAVYMIGAVSDWTRAIHLIGVVFWVGGFLVLTLHLARHADKTDAPNDDFASFESTAYYALVLPGMLIALLTGLYALLVGGLVTFLNPGGPWGATFHAKLLFVGLLIGVDQFAHFKMRRLHRSGDVNRGTFIAAHAIGALLFIGTAVLIQGKVLV